MNAIFSPNLAILSPGIAFIFLYRNVTDGYFSILFYILLPLQDAIFG
jgi:hypothetical protein